MKSGSERARVTVAKESTYRLGLYVSFELDAMLSANLTIYSYHYQEYKIRWSVVSKSYMVTG